MAPAATAAPPPHVTRHYGLDQIAVATRVIHNTRYIIDDALMERCIALDKLPLVKLERGLNGTNVELNALARNKQIKNHFFGRPAPPPPRPRRPRRRWNDDAAQRDMDGHSSRSIQTRSLSLLLQLKSN